MYMGVPMSSISTDDTNPAGMTEPKKSSGTRMAMSPDTSRPMISQLVRSSSSGPKAYDTESRVTSRTERPPMPPGVYTALWSCPWS